VPTRNCEDLLVSKNEAGSVDLKLRLRTRVASRFTNHIMSASASKSADTSKVDQPTASETEKPSQQSQLGALEEDDEFEEFPAQGAFTTSSYS
jgi:hypothetical protein